MTRPQALAAIALTMGVLRHAEPMVSEYLGPARFGESAFVIRAEPSGVPTGVGSLSMWMELVVHIRRFVKRDQTWMIRVRRSEDDPFGNVVHQEVAADKDAARKRVAEIKGEIRCGQFS